MPAPLVLLGIPFIGAVLGKLFTSFVETLAKYFTKKIAVRVVAVGAVIFFFGGMVALIEASIVALSFTMPPQYQEMLVYILPWNTSTCLSAIITAKIARHVYDANTKWIQWSLPGI